MFYNCNSLSVFEAELPYISTASEMFSGCSNLSIFKCNNLGIESEYKDLLKDAKNSLQHGNITTTKLTDVTEMFLNFTALESMYLTLSGNVGDG